MDSTAIKLEPGTIAEESVAVIFTEIDIEYPFNKKESPESILDNNPGEMSLAEPLNLEGDTVKAIEISYIENDLEVPGIKKEYLQPPERSHHMAEIVNLVLKLKFNRTTRSLHKAMDSTAIKLEPCTSAEESVAVIFTEIDIEYPFNKKESPGSIPDNNSGEMSLAEPLNLEGDTVKAIEISDIENDLEVPGIKKEYFQPPERIHQMAGSINADTVTIKTELVPREENEGVIPYVEIDIGLPDVKKHLLEKTQTADLWTDMKKHSTRERLSCPHCNYSCPGKARLGLHIRIHTGEKPFSCSVCTYSFCQLSNLKRHMRTHCGEEPFSCSDCNYSFPQKGHLTRHMKTHSGKKPFSCSDCSYSCSQKGNLMRHMLIHSGKKPFACSKCNFTCSRKGNMTCHMLTHSGEKPFSCSVCNYSCSRKGHLTRHMLIHSR